MTHRRISTGRLGCLSLLLALVFAGPAQAQDVGSGSETSPEAEATTGGGESGEGESASEPAKEPERIRWGSRVTMDYAIALDDDSGTVVHRNVGDEALTFTQGTRKIPPDLEALLIGLTVGDSKVVALSAKDAFGEVEPDLLQRMPLSTIPEAGRQVGARLAVESRSGKKLTGRVVEIEGDEVVVDLNHVLAGKDLRFECHILAIE